MVKLNSNENARLHFDGCNHRNKVMLVYQRSKIENLIWCQICCVELNTQEMLTIHETSPKHKKKEEAQAEIMQLRDEYLKTLENKTDATNPGTSAIEQETEQEKSTEDI